MKLYYAPGSCALASMAALCEAGADFSACKVKLAEREQDAEWFRAINPLGRVPVLVVDDQTITETIAILSYVAARYPQAELLPFGDSLALARAYEWMAWLATSVHATGIAQVWRTERFVDDAAAMAALREAAPGRLKKAYDEIEARIAGPWALGDRYSAVDPYLGVYYRWGKRLEFDMAGYTRWSDHFARLCERPAIVRALDLEANG